MGGQVVIVEGADLSKPHPLISETSLDNSVTDLLYRPLLSARWENGRVVYLTAEEDNKALARSYEFFGPDSASIRYRLRTDVKWSDGVPVTAHDAKWTIDAQGDPRTASPRQDFNREIREVVAEDDSTLVIHFTRRYPEILYHTAGSPVPRHVYEGTDLANLRTHPDLLNPAGKLVTNGAFRLVGWERGQSVVLERSPDYEPQPSLDRIVFRIVPEETTRMIELQTGNVDMTSVPFHYISEIRRVPSLRLEKQEKRAYEYIAYNPATKSFFADRDIRRALSLAIDINALIAGLQLEEFAQPAGGPYAPVLQGLYDPAGQPALPYDTVEANRIFASKGWTRGPDGILRKGGERLSFTLLTNAENRRRVDVAQIVEQQWKRVGVEALIQTLEFNTVIERTTSRQFDASIGGWNVGLSADLYQMWGDPKLPFNFVGYDSPPVREAFRRALEQPTEELAAPYWREAASMIAADNPYTWLYYYDTVYGVADRFQGVVVNTLGQYQNAEGWFIAQ
jgi:peptide/nickel transport system substrate-binding protein